MTKSREGVMALSRAMSDALKDARPKKRTGEPVALSLDANLEKRIDTWARQQPDTPGRPEAIRRLLERALGGADKKPM